MNPVSLSLKSLSYISNDDTLSPGYSYARTITSIISITSNIVYIIFFIPSKSGKETNPSMVHLVRSILSGNY